MKLTEQDIKKLKFASELTLLKYQLTNMFSYNSKHISDEIVDLVEVNTEFYILYSYQELLFTDRTHGENWREW